MTQICKHCLIEKDFTLLNFPATKVKGKVYLEKTCKSCKIKKGVARAKERYHTDPDFKNRKLQSTERCRVINQTERNETWEKRVESIKIWRKNNPDKIHRHNQGRHGKRYANPLYRANKQMSNRINSLIHDKDRQSWLDMVDYTIDELKTHLENKFRDGMTWENYGSVWHIDHIKPVSHFSFTSKHDLEFKECWKLENLQPLLVYENLSKGNRFIG